MKWVFVGCGVAIGSAAVAFGCGGHVDVACGAGTRMVDDKCVIDIDGSTGSAPSEDGGGGGDAAVATSAPPDSGEGETSIDAARIEDATDSTSDAAADGARVSDATIDAAVGLDGSAGDALFDVSNADATSADASIADDANIAVSCAAAESCADAVPMTGNGVGGTFNYCVGSWSGTYLSGSSEEWIQLNIVPKCFGTTGYYVVLDLMNNDFSLPAPPFGLEVFQGGEPSDGSVCSSADIYSSVDAGKGPGGYYLQFDPGTVTWIAHVVPLSDAGCFSGVEWRLAAAIQ